MSWGYCYQAFRKRLVKHPRAHSPRTDRKAGICVPCSVPPRKSGLPLDPQFLPGLVPKLRHQEHIGFGSLDNTNTQRYRGGIVWCRRWCRRDVQRHAENHQHLRECQLRMVAISHHNSSTTVALPWRYVNTPTSPFLTTQLLQRSFSRPERHLHASYVPISLASVLSGDIQKHRFLGQVLFENGLFPPAEAWCGAHLALLMTRALCNMWTP